MSHIIQRISASGVGPLDARNMIRGWFAEQESVWFVAAEVEGSNKDAGDFIE